MKNPNHNDLADGGKSHKETMLQEYRKHYLKSKEIRKDAEKKKIRKEYLSSTKRMKNTSVLPVLERNPLNSNATVNHSNGRYSLFLRSCAKNEMCLETWAVIKLQGIIRGFLCRRFLRSAFQPEDFLKNVSRSLFTECCKCFPYRNGSVRTHGVLGMASPDMNKIKRILSCPKHQGLDLLEPHETQRLTAVHVACQRGYIDLVKLLLEFWTNNPVSSNLSPYSIPLLIRLHQKILIAKENISLLKESEDVIRIIEEMKLPCGQVFEAFNRLHFEDKVSFANVVKACGHPLALAKDKHGNTPLHYAAEGGYLELCRFLLDEGSSVNEQNNTGETPMHFGISSMHEQVCELFIQHNADVQLSRYISFTACKRLLYGTIVGSPDGDELCHPAPEINSNSHFFKHLNNRVSNVNRAMAAQNKTIKNRKESKRMGKSKPISQISRKVFPSGTVGFLQKEYSVIGKSENQLIYFLPAPGPNSSERHTMQVFFLEDHIPYSEYLQIVEEQDDGKILHLLIRHLPKLAKLAVDLFRKPLFRCGILKNVRDFEQSWSVNNHLCEQEKKRSLIEQMNRHTARNITSYSDYMVLTVLFGFFSYPGYYCRTKFFYSKDEQHVAEKNHDNIIRDPKGIVYEYRYDNELCDGLSSTLRLIIETECKELISHPWVEQLLDHKWNRFGKSAFLKSFNIYLLFFCSFFTGTYLRIGDTFFGMPVGGYRKTLHNSDLSKWDYIRDMSNLVNILINFTYTIREFKELKEIGFRSYIHDGWNCFDFIHIFFVWLYQIYGLLRIIKRIDFPELWEEYTIYVWKESTPNKREAYRFYHFEMSIICLVCPLMFIKFLHFARANEIFGPFVRMIFKMARDIMLFLVVFAVFLFGFAYSFFVLQIEGYKTFLAASTSIFQISLGQWDWDAIRYGGPVAIGLFLAYSVIGPIMLLNLLIAMMGKTYEDIWEDRFLFFQVERAKVILSIQNNMNDKRYQKLYWCQRLYVLEADQAIEGIQVIDFEETVARKSNDHHNINSLSR